MEVVFKFTDNRRKSERTIYWESAHVSVCICYINTCWVRIIVKQKGGKVRLVIISVAVFDKKLSSIREMSASCNTRIVLGFTLHNTENIPLLLHTDNSCVVCVGIVAKGNVQVCD